jgi:hypothetical protein
VSFSCRSSCLCFGIKKRSLNVKADEVLVKEVSQEFFEDFIVFSGQSGAIEFGWLYH